MARQPHHYEALRDAQREALENVAEAAPSSEPAVTASIEAEQPAPAAEQDEPTRPEGHYGRSFVWTGEGGMAQQQASALDYVKAHAAERAADRGEFQSAPPLVEAEAVQSQDAPSASSSVNQDSVEMTDAQVARAQQLAGLVQAEEQSQQQSLDVDHSPEQ